MCTEVRNRRHTPRIFIVSCRCRRKAMASQAFADIAPPNWGGASC